MSNKRNGFKKGIEYLVDVFIQDGQQGDECLHRQGFNIDEHLFNKNSVYNDIINKIIDYMGLVLHADFKDYGKLKGISGANIGIPFNIVAVIHKGITHTFINPSVTKVSQAKVSVLSNCGSINLPKPIKVERYMWVWVNWMDTEGAHHKEKFTVKRTGKMGDILVSPISLTLQHEIDHNNGILITDLSKNGK